MVNDNQRREVAERLRITKAECDERDYPWMVEDLLQALGFETYEDGEDGIFDLLGDLIDPTCHVISTISYDWSNGTEYAHELSCGHMCYTDCPEPSAYCCKCGRRVVEKEDERCRTTKR